MEMTPEPAGSERTVPPAGERAGERAEAFRAALERILVEDAELLERLAR